MSESSIRVAPITPGTRPELAAIEARITAERGRISLLYQVLLNSEAIATGWEAMLTAVRNRTSIPGDLRELIILRIAVLNAAPFEFEAHAPIALREGLAPEKLSAIRDLEIGGVFDGRERLVIELTDAMTRDVDVSDPLMQRVRSQYDERECVELVATVAAYNMVSRFLVALRIGH